MRNCITQDDAFLDLLNLDREGTVRAADPDVGHSAGYVSHHRASAVAGGNDQWFKAIGWHRDGGIATDGVRARCPGCG